MGCPWPSRVLRRTYARGPSSPRSRARATCCAAPRASTPTSSADSQAPKRLGAISLRSTRPSTRGLSPWPRKWSIAFKKRRIVPRLRSGGRGAALMERMDRRSLLASAAATGATIGLGGCRPAGSPGEACASFPHADLEEKTIAELSAKMDKHELLAVELVDRYVARIEAI